MFEYNHVSHKMDNVYKWCSQLEKLRTELQQNKETERVTSVRVDDVNDFIKACTICNANCTTLGKVDEKVHFHGGNYKVTKEQVRIQFKQ